MRWTVLVVDHVGLGVILLLHRRALEVHLRTRKRAWERLNLIVDKPRWHHVELPRWIPVCVFVQWVLQRVDPKISMYYYSLSSVPSIGHLRQDFDADSHFASIRE